VTTAIRPLDVETAGRILRRVGYDQRFPIGRLVPPVGLLSSSVRGLEELVLALRPEPQSLAGANLERLADWIERAVGDADGAAEVRLAVRTAPSYVEACLAVHDRLAARVQAAREALATSPDDVPQQAGSAGRE
jgi:hypothetical protein